MNLRIVQLLSLAAVCALGALAWWGLDTAWPRRRRHRAAPVPSRSPQVTMYSRVGVDAIRTVVEQFYRRVLHDPVVSDFFRDLSDEDIARLKRHQALFFGQLLGGPVCYSPEVLRGAHSHLHISTDAYAIVVGHLLAVLYGLDTPSDIIRALCMALEDLRPLVTTPTRAGRGA